MKPVRALAALLLTVVKLGAAIPVVTESKIRSLSMSDLKQQLSNLDDELNQLSSLSLLSGIGSVGYRSQTHKSPTVTEWVQIDLDKEASIDQIVLVPALWRDTKSGFRADGFPRKFKILAGTAGDTVGKVVASF